MGIKLTYDEVDRLIVRYQSGVSTSKENNILLGWAKLSDDNKTYFVNNMSLLDIANKPYLDFDSNGAFEKFKNQAFEKQFKPRRIINFTPFVRIAASILVILSISIITISIINRDVEQITLVSEVQVLNKDLPDDSQIALQKGSKIVYPSRFVKDSREVEVAGQVFFEVMRNEKKPFVVHAGPVDIEVLGTSFDVHNDTILKTITITVETGKVKVTYPEKDFVTYLEPKEQCIIDWGQKSAVEDVVEDENYKGWLTGVLVFESSPLYKVVKDLNSLYPKKIFIGDKVLNTCMLTTKIDNLPQEEVVRMLEKSLNLEVIDNGEMYILIGEGCSQ